MNAVQTRRLTQEMGDTYQRALAGGPFYAAAWLLVGLYGGAFARAPWTSGSLLLAFIVLSIWRFLHRPLHDAPGPQVARWLQLHWAIVLSTTALWGGLFCWTTLDLRFGESRTTALLYTLGLGTAIAHAFSMRRDFALAGVALLCLPGLSLLLMQGDPTDRANALMMAVYLLYVLIALVRSHAEYQQRLDLDQELRRQRDLFSRLSRMDPLTELANRRQFADVLESATAHARTSGAPLSLLLLDVDHFKQVNDSHGHALGDACLMAIAKRLQENFGGSGDLAARVGGEEFGVVLQGHGLHQAAERAERFRDSLVQQPIVQDGILLAMTASIGVAEFDPGLHADVDALYHAADSAVYRAKAAGRNRVCRDNQESLVD